MYRVEDPWQETLPAVLAKGGFQHVAYAAHNAAPLSVAGVQLRHPDQRIKWSYFTNYIDDDMFRGMDCRQRDFDIFMFGRTNSLW